jgi:hypothetical protein
VYGDGVATAAFLVSVLSACIAAGAVRWARITAEAAERTAVAGEQAVTVERQALAVEREALTIERTRYAQERWDRDARQAPRFVVAGATYVNGDTLFCQLRNDGVRPAVIERATLHNHRSVTDVVQIDWPHGPQRADPGRLALLTIDLPKAEFNDLLGMHLVLAYRIVGGVLAAEATFWMLPSDRMFAGHREWDVREGALIRTDHD